MRYYNENPQVTHWMGKCAMLQQELDVLNKKLEDAERVKDFYKKEYLRIGRLSKETFEHFDALPWYRKMFYKFRL